MLQITVKFCDPEGFCDDDGHLSLTQKSSMIIWTPKKFSYNKNLTQIHSLYNLNVTYSLIYNLNQLTNDVRVIKWSLTL